MNTKRNATLDGLRGIAVLIVLLYHQGLLNSGWLGVDAFFALSGFLITSILRQSRMRQDFWRIFWIKRVFRILPPLVLVLLLTVALGFPLSCLQAGAYLLSFGDILAYLRPHFQPLRPLWSLAVEEHFYLFWPLLIRSCKRSTLITLLSSVLAIEPLLRCIVTAYISGWEVIYFLTPFRLDGLAAGALLAVLLEDAGAAAHIRRWCGAAAVSSAALWIGLRLLLGNAFTRDEPSGTYNALCYSLVAGTCCALLAYLVTRKESLASRMLAWGPLPWLGLISYGMYLYQVPVQEAVARVFPQLGRFAIAIDLPLTIAIAVLSYYAVELPCMRLAKRQTSVSRLPSEPHVIAKATS